MKKTIIYIIFILSGVTGTYSQNTYNIGTITDDYTYKLEQTATNAVTIYTIGFTVNSIFTITAKETLSNTSFFLQGYYIGTSTALSTGVGLNTPFVLPKGQYRLEFINPNPGNKAFKLEIAFSPTVPKNVTPNGENYIKTIVPLTGKGTVSGNPDNNEIVSFQYFDGLGRPVETVQQKITPAKKDLVVLQEYDEFGRESFSWLPTPTANTTGAFVAGTSVASMAKTAYGNDANPHTKPVYEFSPLNRMKEQYGPGAEWQTKGKAVKTEYLANTTADNCIYYYMSGDALYKNATNHAANTLYVTKVTDEDGKISYSFVNKLGQTILSRQMNGAEKHDTYYVFDDYGNLRWILPPMIESVSNLSESCAYYGYYYKYDGRNRCIEKKLPGVSAIYYVYDKADRLIFSQDSEQRTTTSWTFYKYDALDRMILTGVWKNSGKTQANLVSSFGHLLATETFSDAGAYNYTWNTLSGTSGTMVTQAFYYDNYDFKTTTTGLNNANYTYTAPAGFDNQRFGVDTAKVKNKGLMTASISVMLDDPNKKINTVFYYDYRGRMIQSVASNHLSGYEKEYINYSFTGNPVWKYSIHSASGKDNITELYKFAYDHANRPTTTTYKLNSDPEFTLSTLTYNEKGQVASKIQSGSVATTTYAYNIRNWLTNINAKHSGSSIIFDERLYYNESYAGSTAQWNGNISAVSWRHMVNSSTLGYRYTYDGLNRLKKGQFLSGTDVDNTYNEEIGEYDKNGNIKVLKRYALNAYNATTGIMVDDLTLNYRGNQITGISDAVPASTSIIGFVMPSASMNTNPVQYNGNGAIKHNYYNGIAGISYNMLNLPEKIQFMQGHSTKYSYDAEGAKRTVVHQSVKSNMNVLLGTLNYTPNPTDIKSTLTTDYCAGGHIVYENGALKRILNSEGYVTKQSNGVNSYNYYVKDHLGNNRAVFAASTTSFQCPVQEVNYYPFGMQFYEIITPKGGYSTGAQPYKFNGCELDEMHGLNQTDLGNRSLYHAIGQFTTMDRFCEKFPWQSPYVHAGNNPVNYIDINGDSIDISFRTGFLGLGGRQSVRYENGNLYNKDGSAYTGKVTGFLKSAVGALGSLNSTTEGASLVSELQGSTNIFTIKSGSSNRFVADSPTKAGANLSEVQTVTGNTAGSSGSGGTIYWNRNSTSGGLDLTGSTSRPAYVGLGHEMGHASDSNQGLLHYSSDYTNVAGATYFSSYNGLLKSEWRAVYRENLIRGQAGIPLRTHYGYDMTTGVPLPIGPRLLTPANLPINYR